MYSCTRSKPPPWRHKPYNLGARATGIGGRARAAEDLVIPNT